jgi:hypothetical protein
MRSHEIPWDIERLVMIYLWLRQTCFGWWLDISRDLMRRIIFYCCFWYLVIYYEILQELDKLEILQDLTRSNISQTYMFTYQGCTWFLSRSQTGFCFCCSSTCISDLICVHQHAGHMWFVSDISESDILGYVSIPYMSKIAVGPDTSDSILFLLLCHACFRCLAASEFPRVEDSVSMSSKHPHALHIHPRHCITPHPLSISKSDIFLILGHAFVKSSGCRESLRTSNSILFLLWPTFVALRSSLELKIPHLHPQSIFLPDTFLRAIVFAPPFWSTTMSSLCVRHQCMRCSCAGFVGGTNPDPVTLAAIPRYVRISLGRCRWSWMNECRSPSTPRNTVMDAAIHIYVMCQEMQSLDLTNVTIICGKEGTLPQVAAGFILCVPSIRLPISFSLIPKSYSSMTQTGGSPPLASVVSHG